MSSSKEVAKNESGELALTERPDWMTDESKGNENVSNNDITIPRIEIIQDLSPQHKKNKPEYIEGAAPGMAYNSASGELYGDVINFIPVYYQKQYLLWKDINKGGGFGGAFDTEEMANAEKLQQETPNDWEVVDTYIHYVLVLKQGSTMDNPIFEEAMISMSKSQSKVSRSLNTLVKMAGGARWSKIYTLSVVTDTNSNNQEYYNWRAAAKGFVSKPMYETAGKLYEIIKAGERKVDHGAGKATGTQSAEKEMQQMADDDMEM